MASSDFLTLGESAVYHRMPGMRSPYARASLVAFILQDPLKEAFVVGKKQTRQNRGARTGGHERTATAETKEPTRSPAPQDMTRPAPQEVSHKQPRKFGHN